MKIAYISPITIPSRSADSVQVMKACESLQHNGADVTLMIPYRDKTEKDVKDVYAFYECADRFKILWQKSFLLPERYSILKIGLKAGFSSSDIVLTRSIPAGLIAAILGKSVIVEIHEPFDRNRALSFLSSLLILLPTMKGVITNCEALRRHTIKRFPKLRDKSVAIQNGANEMKCANPLEFEPIGKLHVGYAGQLYKGKGVEVIRDLAPRHPDAIFHVVGGLPEDIQYWKGQLKNTNNVKFHGFVSPAELSRYIMGFDIVLAPYQRVVYGYKASSNLAEWTSPMKIFDYMSAGKPIIASDLAFMTEVLEQEKNALLCAPDDIDSWSAAIESLQGNRGYAEQLGAEAKLKFMKEYKWEQRARKVLEFIDSVTNVSLKR